PISLSTPSLHDALPISEVVVEAPHRLIFSSRFCFSQIRFGPDMKDRDIHACMRLLKQEVRRWKEPVVGVVAKASCDPFQILISRSEEHTSELQSRVDLV